MNIKGLNIFENEIKFTACVDATTLFLRDKFIFRIAKSFSDL